MTWSAFFKSPPVKLGVIAGTIGLVIGFSGSAAISFYFASQCSELVDKLLDTVNESISIPELTAMLSIRGHSIPITLTGINVVLPDCITDMVSHADTLSDYCFSVPFLLGSCLTILLAFTLAALAGCAAMGIDVYKQPVEKEDNNYSLLTMDSQV